MSMRDSIDTPEGASIVASHPCQASRVPAHGDAEVERDRRIVLLLERDHRIVAALDLRPCAARRQSRRARAESARCRCGSGRVGPQLRSSAQRGHRTGDEPTATPAGETGPVAPRDDALVRN